ncbi:RusA family crossover junction endodeoxyribonuclease [Paraclostridium sordellii 8483]|uniref:RusA family crossover junction endodeoxyribonuclease n=1 Tax=Paraclostridium sordellii TaxID=1505 RepID=UPI0002E9EE1A|nr:RusA family crossover junction endodeoxyribonuclease [Paeniclostridium sordellii]TAN63527.1 RusA family crossover junction endodeoxyribonuclease [Paeniclostridium sordellii 8483]
MKVKFVIDGEPVGKARPRVNTKTKKAYTPEKTKMYENYIKLLYRCQVKHYFEGYVRLTVTAYYSIAKRDSKKVKQQKIDNILRPSKKPDIDNVYKLVADALNTIAYKDDAAIVEGDFKKYYSEKPRVEVTIEDIQ